MSLIKLVLPFPPTVNVRYNVFRGKRRTSQKVKNWRDEAALSIKLQKISAVPPKAHLFYLCDKPDNRKRDAENYAKHITDLLVSMKILEDDNADYVSGVYSGWTYKQGKTVTVLIADDFTALQEAVNLAFFYSR